MLIKKMLYMVFIFSIITVAYASENNAESPVDTPTEVPTVVPTETPAEVTPTETPIEMPTVAPTETPAEVAPAEVTPIVTPTVVPTVSADEPKTDENDVGPKANASAIAIATSDNNSTETSVVVGAESNKTIVKDNKGTTVISNVSAFAYSEGKGDSVSLVSRAYAEGQIVRGAGGSHIEGSQTNAGVSITVRALENGLNGLTIISYASGLDAIGYTWASAWAETIERFNKATEYIRRNTERNTGRNTGFNGFLFGKSDTERYTYFKFQSINLSADNGTKQRASYWMGIIADDYGINQTQFEKKYNITTNKFGGVELVGINKSKNMVIVRINGTLYDIPYGNELDIEGKKINITEVNETNNIVGIKVVSLKGASS